MKTPGVFDLFTDTHIPAELLTAPRGGESIRFRTEFDFSTVTYQTSRVDVASFDVIITALHDGSGKTSGYLAQTIDSTGLCCALVVKSSYSHAVREFHVAGELPRHRADKLISTQVTEPRAAQAAL